MTRPILKLGDKGAAVGEWQRLLLRDGYELGPKRDDEDFGQRTHNATIAWEWSHGLARDGIVDDSEWQVMLSGVAADRSPPTERVFDLTRVPLVEAANWSRDYPPVAKRLIVIHCMEAAEAATTAEAVAGWFAGKSWPSKLQELPARFPGKAEFMIVPSALPRLSVLQRSELEVQIGGKWIKVAPRTSAHYCVDSDSVLCCVASDRVAWHAPGANKDGIGIELAGYARQSPAEWSDAYSSAMLRLAAKLVRALGRRHGIPIEFRDVDEVRDPETRGITTHEVVSHAFGKSTHTDPGPHFPMERLLEWSRAA